MIKKITLGIMSLILVGGLAACAPQTKSDKLQIATTSFALKNFIETIGGDNVEVVFSLTGNPHHFELTQADAKTISDADAFMNIEAGDYISIGEKIKNVNPQLPAFDLATNITLIEATGHDHDHDEEEHGHATTDESNVAVNLHLDGLKEHYHTGDTLELEAHIEKAVEFEHFHWFKKMAGETEFSVISEQEAEKLAITLTGEDNGAQIIAKQYNAAHEVVGISEPVTIEIDNHDTSVHSEGTVTGDDHDHADGQIKEAMDPHVWLSPVLSQTLADNIAESLSTLDKDNSEVYKKNATDLKTKLVSLDKKIAEELKNRQQNSMLVSHAAYGYLAKEYNIIQRGVTDNSDHSESTQQAIIELDEYIKTNGIKYIFVEDNIESSSAVTVLKTQHSLSELTLSNIETNATNSDYFTLMEKNVEALKKGLEVA